MKAYIYEIVNKINKKRYIGQTWNIDERKQSHLKKLRGKYHPNAKLQNAWNKYGEENFTFIIHSFYLDTQKELDSLEIEWIKNADSFLNGYNLTEGGQGGYQISPNKRKLNFEQFCIAILGNRKYSGMTNKTAKWFSCDSSTISSILNKNAYPDFQEQLLKLTEDQRSNFLKEFEDHFQEEIKTTRKLKKVTEELTFEILCVVSCYSRGTEQAILKKFGLSKSFVINCFREKGSHKEAKERLKNLSKEQILKIGKDKFSEWELQKYNCYLKEDYKDLFDKYSKYIS